MINPDTWTKSSFSGGGQGNACVEVAHLHTHIAIRDSKTPARATVRVPAGAFSAFVDAIKHAAEAHP
ncbi:DUF397 domain-containing protein [Streptomyces poonensis]|uniref:DUF397 domain-containing protein n=1 Tax=Streptomyces poonensis TaxID=68255 RepID=A0A918P900_9ACTN|nr:DUF397 domain-containing protein [Streptomyces poonensis]GGY92945.1 hypothetical protein GCM10010365_09400 [Streptomyces poonensis]GLJ87620.1 hypothetical protein GCM10017589_02200 [Streptomyces poonensis]